MKKIAISVDSVTTAIRARKLLRREGILSRLTRPDSELSVYGCAYAIEVKESDFFAAVAALRRAEISYRTSEK